MSSKEFNEAFRKAMRPFPEQPEEEPAEPPPPARRQSIDAGAGTGGDRTPTPPRSMNDLIRHAARDHE
jgi:hypothetical protein